jgi:alpha-1,3-rhamnosyl/mannosyltransferase
MRVLVNDSAAIGQRTGIGHYTAQLVSCLRQLFPEHQVETYPSGWMRRLREARAGGGQGNPAASGAVANLRQRTLFFRRQLGRQITAWHFRWTCPRSRFDLYHEPNFIPFPSDLPTVATVHDLSVLKHPAWHPADRVKFFERHFERAVTRCQHVLADSEFVRQEIIETLHLPPERVTRTYMGVRPGLRPLPEAWVRHVLARLDLPSQYLLYLGTIEPRKNLGLLLRSYCALPEPVRQRWPLLLVGRWGWNTADVARLYHDHARHHGVRHLGYVPDEYVPALYNGARALLYPSLYEGFGLPPIEMMACGGAVVAARTGALIEIVGPKAHLVDPEDADGWRDALLRVVQDCDWWQSLRKGAVAVAQPFTWENCARDTLRIYRAVSQARAVETFPLASTGIAPRRRAG